MAGARAAAGLTLGWIVGMATPGIAEGGAECGRNAAFHYLRAAALVPRPVTAEQFDMLRFAEREIRELPPQAFNAWPEAGRWLMAHDAILDALEAAGRCRECDFCVERPGSPLLELSHLGPLRGLRRYGAALAKAYEFAQNPQASARLYGELLRMIVRLDSDNNLGSGLAAADELQILLEQMVPFLGRVDDEGAMRILLRAVQDIPRPAFHLGEYLREESRRYARWLMADADAAVDRLNRLYGQREQRPAVDRLMAVEGDRRRRRLQRWVMDYEARMIRLAAAVEKPYLEGIRKIRAMDRERARLVRSGGDLGPDENPLVPLLQPEMERVYQRMLLAEGQLEVLRLLSAGASYRVREGRWPLNREEIKGVFGGRPPCDPFSGEPLFYHLVRAQPRVVIRVPRWMARQRGLRYVWDLSEMQERGRRRLEKFIKENLAPPMSPALRSPVPAGR